MQSAPQVRGLGRMGWGAQAWANRLGALPRAKLARPSVDSSTVRLRLTPPDPLDPHLGNRIARLCKVVERQQFRRSWDFGCCRHNSCFSHVAGRLPLLLYMLVSRF